MSKQLIIGNPDTNKVLGYSVDKVKYVITAKRPILQQIKALCKTKLPIKPMRQFKAIGLYGIPIKRINTIQDWERLGDNL